MQIELTQMEVTDIQYSLFERIKRINAAGATSHARTTDLPLLCRTLGSLSKSLYTFDNEESKILLQELQILRTAREDSDHA